MRNLIKLQSENKSGKIIKVLTVSIAIIDEYWFEFN